METHLRVAVSEFLGTFALTFFGAGAICTDVVLRGKAVFGVTDLLMIAAAHAVVLAVMVTALGHISGAHFNPAVTVAALMTRHIAPLVAGVYVAAQFLGALVSAALLVLIFPSAITQAAAFGAPALGDGVTVAHGLVLESLLTFFLVTVIFATAVDPRGAFKSIAGFGIGLTLFFEILVGGPITGAAMNPARAFGPAVLAGRIDGIHFLVYWGGPLLGALLAALLYQYLLLGRAERRR